jgi:hypothetical protein
MMRFIPKQISPEAREAWRVFALNLHFWLKNQTRPRGPMPKMLPARKTRL